MTRTVQYMNGTVTKNDILCTNQISRLLEGGGQLACLAVRCDGIANDLWNSVVGSE